MSGIGTGAEVCCHVMWQKFGFSLEQYTTVFQREVGLCPIKARVVEDIKKRLFEKERLHRL
jgi:hypothetical protein